MLKGMKRADARHKTPPKAGQAQDTRRERRTDGDKLLKVVESLILPKLSPFG
jgi:hypothetical protein